jgi:hypothetical protein
MHTRLRGSNCDVTRALRVVFLLLFHVQLAIDWGLARPRATIMDEVEQALAPAKCTRLCKDYKIYNMTGLFALHIRGWKVRVQAK